MPYNLLREAWIPVWRKRPDGSRYRGDIRPCQISEPNDPPIALAASRPDFNGALVQFLIGLVQTASAPRTEREWRKCLNNPPSPAKLDEAFGGYEHAFNLDGDEPRFMQDYERGWIGEGNRKLLQTFLLDSPGEGTIDDNMDHFRKEQEVVLCAPGTAQALFVYQTNVPHTGRYPNHAALRGACPTTAVIVADTLWSTVWMNVLVHRDFEVLAGISQPCDDALLFPWLKPHSSLNDSKTHQHDVHAAQMYWGMPQRIVLKKVTERADESILGNDPYNGFCRKTNGIDYQHPWQHPLQPSTSLNASTMGYRGWTSFSTELGQGAAPLNVKRFNRTANSIGVARPELWVFAYEKDGFKASIKAYHEARMPLFVVPPALRPNFEDFAHQLVSAADEAVNALRFALKKALFGTWKKDKGKWDYPTSKESGSTTQQSQLADAATRFWRGTEQDFYAALGKSQEVLETQPDVEYGEAQELLAGLRGAWLGLVRNHILELFDEVALWGTFRASRPQSVGRARRDLLRDLGKLRKALALPDHPTDLDEEGENG